MSDLLPTTIYDLGYSKSLLKIDSFYDEPAILKEKTGNLLPPTLLSSGQLVENLNFGESDYNGSLRSGDIAWNKDTGVITGGTGVLIYRGGIIGASAGVVTFSLDSETGDAVFSGTITSSAIYSAFISTDPAGSTGERVVINNADNTISFYNSSNAVVAQLGGGTLIGTALRIVLDSVTAVGVRVDSAHSADIGFQYISSGNYAQAGVNIQLTGATNSGTGVNINHEGTGGEGIKIDVTNGARGILLQNTAAGEALYISSTAGESIFINHSSDSHIGIEVLYSGRQNAIYVESTDTAATQSALLITGNFADSSLSIIEFKRTSAGRILDINTSINSSIEVVGLRMNLANAGSGLEYAFEFNGSEIASGAVSGTQDRKIRIFTASGDLGFIPIYDS